VVFACDGGVNGVEEKNEGDFFKGVFLDMERIFREFEPKSVDRRVWAILAMALHSALVYHV
jgi:hypothetical protein